MTLCVTGAWRCRVKTNSNVTGLPGGNPDLAEMAATNHLHYMRLRDTKGTTVEVSIIESVCLFCEVFVASLRLTAPIRASYVRPSSSSNELALCAGATAVIGNEAHNSVADPTSNSRRQERELPLRLPWVSRIPIRRVASLTYAYTQRIRPSGNVGLEVGTALRYLIVASHNLLGDSEPDETR